LLQSVLTAVLATNACVSPQLFDSLSLLLIAFYSVCPREVSGIFLKNDQILNIYSVSITITNDYRSRLLRINVLQNLLGHALPIYNVDIVMAGPAQTQRNVRYTRKNQLLKLFDCLLDGREDIMKELVGAIVLICIINLSSDDQKYLVGLCLEHNLANKFFEHLIPYANSTDLFPNQARAIFKFIEMVFDMQRFEVFYNNDLSVLMEIFVRLLNDTHPSNPLSKSYLDCLLAFLSWPDYETTRFFSNDLREAVNRISNLSFNERATIDKELCSLIQRCFELDI